MDILFSSVTGTSLTVSTFFLATISSIIIGLLIAACYKLKNEYSASFIVTLVLLPAVVQLVIMLVNGSVGTGIAVAGAFSLVRFRSVAGSGQEITSIFLAMAAGLATGMGYIGIAFIFTIIILLVNYIVVSVGFTNGNDKQQIMKIMVPESLDFEGIFDDIFEKYTTKAEIVEVKTANMGALYRLEYRVTFRKDVSVKAMMDEMRTRNGNLEISCSRKSLLKEASI